MRKFDKVCEELEARVMSNEIDRELKKLAQRVKVIANNIPKTLREKDDSTLKSLLIEIKKQLKDL